MLKLTKIPPAQKSICVDYEGAKLHFRIPNELDKFDLFATDKTSERIKLTFDGLEKIENIVDETDKPIATDKLLELLSLEQITKIMILRNAALEDYYKAREAETKNSSISIETPKNCSDGN